MVSAVMYSSASGEWSTPQDLFDKLNSEFCFGLDAAASSMNAKCRAYFTEEDDALTKDWTAAPGPVWLNPPYGRGIGAWIWKAYNTAHNGKTVVCLLPARTDTKWWHDWVEDGGEVKVERRFLRGRLKFGGAKHGAPFPSVVVIFHGRAQ